MPEPYDVLLTEQAQEEIDDAHEWWAAHRSLAQANQWYIGFYEAMISLERNPDRCSLAPENDRFPYELRQLTYGLGAKPTHRAIFTIRDQIVLVLRVRHLGQRSIGPDD